MKLKRFFASLSVLVILVSVVGVLPARVAPSSPPVIDDATLKAMFSTLDGADVLPTTPP